MPPLCTTTKQHSEERGDITGCAKSWRFIGLSYIEEGVYGKVASACALLHPLLGPRLDANAHSLYAHAKAIKCYSEDLRICRMAEECEGKGSEVGTPHARAACTRTRPRARAHIQRPMCSRAAGSSRIRLSCSACSAPSGTRTTRCASLLLT